MILNKSIMAKADMEVADLIADGGYLQDEQAEAFVLKAIKESVVMKRINVMGMRSHTKKIPKVGISGWVLKPGTSGQALAAADRVKPTTEEVELETKLMKAEIRLNDEVLEDNIEGGKFKNTVRNMMAEHAALDMDQVIVNGDTTGATGTVLDLIDGVLVSATSHIVNGGTVAINKGMFRDAVKAMPSEYRRLKGMQQFWTSENAEIDYRDYVAGRVGDLADMVLQEEKPLKYSGRPIVGVPVFPDDLGVGSNCTNIVLTHPKNCIWGLWRKIRFETDRDITTGEWIMVATLRAGFVYEEEDAVVKVTNVLTA